MNSPVVAGIGDPGPAEAARSSAITKIAACPTEVTDPGHNR